MESNPENDLMQLWSVITELGEQLTQNRSISVSLYGLTGKIKVCSIRMGLVWNLQCLICTEPSSQLADRFRVASVRNPILLPFLFGI